MKYQNNGKESFISFIIKSPLLIFSYFLSLINIFFLILALSKIPLYTAYIYMGSIYILSVMADHYFFNNKMNYIKFLGAFLIFFGILVFNYNL